MTVVVIHCDAGNYYQRRVINQSSAGGTNVRARPSERRSASRKCCGEADGALALFLPSARPRRAVEHQLILVVPPVRGRAGRAQRVSSRKKDVRKRPVYGTAGILSVISDRCAGGTLRRIRP